MPPIRLVASAYDGRSFQAERVRLGIRAYRLAADLGYRTNQLSTWENNHVPIPNDAARRIAEYLGVPLDSFRRQSEGQAC